MKTITLFAGATNGGCRTARYGDFVIMTLQSAAFAVTAQDLQQAEAWARSRTSLGSTQRDRTCFIDRFETVLARSGSGFATKGARGVLSRIVKGMEQNGIDIKEWSVPHNINESVEIQKPKAPAVAVAVAAIATANPELPTENKP